MTKNFAIKFLKFVGTMHFVGLGMLLLAPFLMFLALHYLAISPIWILEGENQDIGIIIFFAAGLLVGILGWKGADMIEEGRERGKQIWFFLILLFTIVTLTNIVFVYSNNKEIYKILPSVSWTLACIWSFRVATRKE